MERGVLTRMSERNSEQHMGYRMDVMLWYVDHHGSYGFQHTSLATPTQNLLVSFRFTLEHSFFPGTYTKNVLVRLLQSHKNKIINFISKKFSATNISLDNSYETRQLLLQQQIIIKHEILFPISPLINKENVCRIEKEKQKFSRFLKCEKINFITYKEFEILLKFIFFPCL